MMGWPFIPSSDYILTRIQRMVGPCLFVDGSA